MDFGALFTILFINPITNLLVACYKLLFILGIPYALGFSIILLTIIIKLIIYPLASAQIKSAHKIQKISPHMAAIREKHKDDKKRQQEEMMKLYREHGVNPAAGCVPVLVQIPILWSLYSVLTNIVGVASLEAINKINSILYFDALKLTKLWDTHFFFLPLAGIPSQMFSSAPYIVFIPLVTGVLQFVLSKMMVPPSAPKPKGKEKDKDKKKEEDFQTMFQTQSLFIFPVMIGFFSFSLPVGLSLYWNTFTLFGILQQYRLAGPGGLEPWIKQLQSRYGGKK